MIDIEKCKLALSLRGYSISTYRIKDDYWYSFIISIDSDRVISSKVGYSEENAIEGAIKELK